MKHITAVAALPDAARAFAALKAHLLADHRNPAINTDTRVRVVLEGNALDMRCEGEQLMFSIEARNDNMLYFIREAVVEHLAELNAEQAETLLWSDGSAQASHPPNFQVLTLLRKFWVAPGLLRMTLLSPDAARLLHDGLHVKLMVPLQADVVARWPEVAPNGKTNWPKGEYRLVVRYFTLRDVRPDAQEVDIDVMEHVGGHVFEWGLQARAGDELGIMGPGGGLPPEPGRTVLFVADRTALPTVARIANLQTDLNAQVLALVPDGWPVLEYLGTSRWPVTPVNEHLSPEDLQALIHAEVSARQTDLLWFGGEHGHYRLLKQTTWPVHVKDTEVVCFWKRGGSRDAVGHD